METVTSTDGTDIAYERRGDGPPVVLVHGTSADRRAWYPVLPHLTDDFETVAIDRRGRGDSGDGDEYALDREVADVRAVVDALECEPILFGHSFGGLVALEAARTADLERLVLYEPAVMTGEHRASADAAGRMADLLDAGEREDAVKLGFRAMGADDVESLPHWPEVIERAETMQREFAAVEEYRVRDAYSVDVPALLLTGDRSVRFLRDGVRAVHDALRESRLVEFDGVGHVFNETAPDRVASEIRSFAFETA